MKLSNYFKKGLSFSFAIVVSLVAVVFLSQMVTADSTGVRLPYLDGSYSQWTPSVGTTHYSVVDDIVCNGSSDYNFTNTVGSRDSYNLNISSIPTGATITTVEITPCASRSKPGGSATINVFYRYNGVDSADAGGYVLNGTTPTQLAPTTFSGLSLVKGSASTLEIGVVLSSGNKGARLSRISATITYIPATPTVSTNLATNVATSSATMNGSANPNGGSTTGWFRYGTVNPGSCNDTFGIRVPSSGGTNLGAGATAVPFSNFISGLPGDTVFYYCAIAGNSGGTGYGNVVNFSTLVSLPAAPTNLTATTATSTVILNWVDNATNESGFTIERKDVATSTIFSEIGSVGANITTFTDSGVNPGAHSYRVRAFNATGFSSYSNTVTATTT